MIRNLPFIPILICCFCLDASAQRSLSDKVRRHQFEVRRKIEEGKRRIEDNRRRQEESASAQAAAKRENAAPEYVFRKRQQLAYSVSIKFTSENRQDRWSGVIGLITDKPTPLRDDGSGYNTAKLRATGHLKAFTNNGLDEWSRLSKEDFVLPDQVVVAPFKVKKCNMKSSPRSKLPGNMSIRYGLLDAILPSVPLFSGSDEHSFTRSYFITRGGMFSGTVSGEGTRKTSAFGSIVNTYEEFHADVKGVPNGFRYQCKQHVRFDSSKSVMVESQTTFATNWGGDNRVDIEVRRISIDDARKAMGESS